MKIAVVGSGISGLGSAWLLSHEHEVHLFESDSRLGGYLSYCEGAFRAGRINVGQFLITK